MQMKKKMKKKKRTEEPNVKTPQTSLEALGVSKQGRCVRRTVAPCVQRVI